MQFEYSIMFTKTFLGYVGSLFWEAVLENCLCLIGLINISLSIKYIKITEVIFLKVYIYIYMYIYKSCSIHVNQV